MWSDNSCIFWKIHTCMSWNSTLALPFKKKKCIILHIKCHQYFPFASGVLSQSLPSPSELCIENKRKQQICICIQNLNIFFFDVIHISSETPDVRKTICCENFANFDHPQPDQFNQLSSSIFHIIPSPHKPKNQYKFKGI